MLKRKELLKVLASAGALTALSYLTRVEASPPTPSLTITKDSFSATADVIVTLEGSVAKAIDAKTRKAVASSTDHAYVIQKAVEEYDGGWVHIKRGTYTLETYDVLSGSINACIRLPHSVKITGDGIEKTILKLGNNVPATMIGWSQLNYVEISGLTLDGNRANNTDSGIDGNQCGILALVGGFSHVIRDVRVINCVRQGIYMGAVQNRIYIENVTLENNGLSGLALDRTAYFDIIGVKALNNGYGGIYVSTNSLKDFEGTIVGGFYYDNYPAGIWLKYARHVKIIGAKCYCNGISKSASGDGILVTDSEDIEIHSPVCHANRRNGIYFVTSTNCHVVGGCCRNNGQGEAADGVRTHDSTYIQVIGLRAYDDQATKTQQYGIREAGTADDYNMFVNCILVGNAAGGISTVGLNTVVANNIT